jgi:hypothetical protein
MVGGTSKRLAALGTALLVASVFVACGESGDSSSTSTSTAGQASGVEIGPLKVVGGGSASYRIPDHHTNVPKWGEETSTRELEAAAVVGHDYLVAMVERDWSRACSYASEILMQILSSNPKGTEKNCPALLSARAKPPPGSDYEASEVEAESLRSDGSWAFLLYRAASAPYYMPMVKEDSGWKVNHVDPVAFYDRAP